MMQQNKTEWKLIISQIWTFKKAYVDSYKVAELFTQAKSTYDSQKIINACLQKDGENHSQSGSWTEIPKFLYQLTPRHQNNFDGEN
jgi:hypothetical protein